ncbi:NAD(P)H-quinone oxidoreductase [Plasticicumulans acidivorans]|nr:NAD(P)H-quinone oxidoreductase [Plasticicumulans acidivorans]
MTAIEITTPGGPDVLKPCTRPLPQPAAGEVLIRVAAAGINRPDCAQRAGAYPAPPGASDLPGLEVAGEIVAVGSEAGDWRVGEAVCALVNGGGYAEYCTAPAGQVLPWPQGLSAIEAAALPETCFTVWSNVFQRGRLAAGEILLVHGGASGIGSTAIPLARARGARVFATAGGALKCAACTQLGAELAIDYREQDFAEAVKAATGGRGVDVILDMVGGDYLPRNLSALAVEGRLVMIAGLHGYKAEINLWTVMAKRLTVTGSTLRPRSAADKAAIAAELRAEVWPLLAAGRFKPLIHASLPLAEAAAAHALLESNAVSGKLVLSV